MHKRHSFLDENLIKLHKKWTEIIKMVQWEKHFINIFRLSLINTDRKRITLSLAYAKVLHLCQKLFVAINWSEPFEKDTGRGWKWKKKKKKGIVQSFPEFALCGYQKGGKMRIGIEMIVWMLKSSIDSGCCWLTWRLCYVTLFGVARI